MSGFHTEKVFLECIDAFLEWSEAKEVLVQMRHSGPDTVKAVMNGGHYNHSKRGFNIFLLTSLGKSSFTQSSLIFV